MSIGTQGLSLPKLAYLSDTIASGTTSGEIDLKGGSLVAIITPSGIASTSYTITASDVTGGTFLTVKNPDTGAAYTGTIAASGWYALAPTVTAGLRFIKVVYGSSETAKIFKYGYREVE